MLLERLKLLVSKTFILMFSDECYDGPALPGTQQEEELKAINVSSPISLLWELPADHRWQRRTVLIKIAKSGKEAPRWSRLVFYDRVFNAQHREWHPRFALISGSEEWKECCGKRVAFPLVFFLFFFKSWAHTSLFPNRALFYCHSYCIPEYLLHNRYLKYLITGWSWLGLAD